MMHSMRRMPSTFPSSERLRAMYGVGRFCPSVDRGRGQPIGMWSGWSSWNSELSGGGSASMQHPTGSPSSGHPTVHQVHVSVHPVP
jgi:hypothetical protein